MTRLKNSVALTRATFRVLFRNPKLLLFPIGSGAGLLLLGLLFFAPDVLGGAPLRGLSDRYAWWVIRAHAEGNPLATLQAVLGLWAIYYCINGVTAFFNTALVRAVLESMRGERVSIGAALRFAASRARPLAAYTALAATIGVVLQAMERLGILEKVAARWLGLGWSTACSLVFPVLVQERRGGPASIRRSASLFKRIWGETLAGGFGLGLLQLGLLAAAVVGAGVLTAAGHCWDLGVPLMAVSVAVVWVLSATLEGIFSAALYIFAAEGIIPEPFDEVELHQLWKVKGGRS